MELDGIEINSKLALAPMAGVTDAAFRQICSGLGAGLTFSEMVSARALCYQDSKTRELLIPFPGEHPFAAQIFGSDPLCMGEAAHRAAEISGADFIDINMGCPVGKIAGNGDGAALMKNPDLAMRIAESVVAHGGRPVTVKIRSGWDKSSINAVPFAKMLERAGVCAVTIHGRTKTQMYSGSADLDIIRDVKLSVQIPVIANGDVFSAGDALHMLEYTGADMVMIGRGALGDPWLFQRASAAVSGEPIPGVPPLDERFDAALHQFELAAQYKGEKRASLEARKHLAWYLKGVPHVGQYKQKASAVATLEDIRFLITKIRSDLI